MGKGRKGARGKYKVRNKTGGMLEKELDPRLRK